ncbi:MAG: hypothetical protein AMS19_10030 [Gemmatimonas sp. SG8_23]|nr:MAG: hypothetical protein AMS19_10030 [Gemmatimonas sp. SG8_23]
MRVTPDALRTFSSEVLTAAGADRDEAEVVAGILVWGDQVGRPEQGVWRLEILVRRLRAGLFASPCHLRIEAVSPAAAVVDGGNGIGHFVADRAVRHAMQLARETGVGAVSVRRSNYLGAVGYYTQLAAREGMLAFAASNSFPKVAAYGGSEPALGTDPLAFAAPRTSGGPLMVDMSTSSSSGSALRWAREEKAGVGASKGAAARPAETAPDLIQPLGGPKGFGLALMVEILSGALSAGGMGHEVRSMYKDFERPGDNSHFFAVFDLERWAGRAAATERIEGLLTAIIHSGGDEPVRIPGQVRWETLQENAANGIPLNERVVSRLEGLARDLSVPLPEALP